MKDQIVRFLIQWKIIIPLALVVLVWIVWPQNKPTIIQKQLVTKQTVAVNADSQKGVAITTLFGVNKKFRCTIESATAVVDDTKIVATITQNKKQTKVIFDGDCLYRWTNGSSSGERSCGLKSYLPYVSQFASNDSLQKLFPQTNELTSACKEILTVDQKVFEVPKSILFKNKKLF